MQTTYKVGDKVRILKAKKIHFGERYWNDGDISEIKRLLDDGRPCLSRNTKELDDRGLPLWSTELQYIEKVEESHAKMTQFKVGDKVRVIANGTAGLPIGTVATVTKVDRDGDVFLDATNVYGNKAFYPRYKVELVSPKPTKNQRISALEKEVETLKVEIETLKAAQKSADIDKIAEGITKMVAKEMNLTPNEQRKAIIDEAKAFVKSKFTNGNGGVGKVVWADAGHNKVEFVVNAEKRTVVAILRLAYAGHLVTSKGIAKCAPDDVFNEHIGKAIALGRALGLDVERFEKAVQPTEFAVGQIALCGRGKPYTITEVREDRGMTNPGTFHWKSELRSGVVKITNDTEAQY